MTSDATTGLPTSGTAASPRTQHSKGARAAMVVVILGAIAAPSAISNQFVMHLLVLALIFALLGVGYDVQFGFAGMLNLGQGAFFGIGAYTVAILTARAEWSTAPAIVAAIAAGVVLAGLLGLVVLRAWGPEFAMMSLGVGQILYLAVSNEVWLTRGPMGIPGVPPARITIGSAQLVAESAHQFYYVALGLLVVCMYVVYRVLATATGSAWLGVRENPLLAGSLGIDAFKARISALFVGGAVSSLAGALYALYIGFVNPSVFSVYYLIVAIAIVIVGGKGTIAGPVLGALLFVLLPEGLRAAESWRLFIFGGALALSVVIMPRGLWPLLVGVVSRRPHSKRDRAATSTREDE